LLIHLIKAQKFEGSDLQYAAALYFLVFLYEESKIVRKRERERERERELKTGNTTTIPCMQQSHQFDSNSLPVT
jgi:hypothetical protein